MKRTILMSLAGLALVAACTDTLTRPSDSAVETSGRLAPQGILKDDIKSNVPFSIDAAAKVMPLTVGGANGTTQLSNVNQNSDGKNGCNLTGGTTLVLSVSSSNVSAATVSPSSVTFTSCGATPTLTVTPVAAGSTTITVSEVSNNTGGSFTLGQATFIVNVSPPPNTAPSLEVAGVTGGALYNKGSVPAATCEVTDAEDGNSSFPATLSAVSGDYSSDGIGNQTASCESTDRGGLYVSTSETYSIVDPSAPVIDHTLAPTSPDGLNGWYKSDVTLTWDVSDDQSPNSLQKTKCDDQNITVDQAETTYSCSATSAGGSVGPVEVKIKRDATAPSVAYTSAAGTVGTNGWYTSSVTATFTAQDALSGPASATQTASTALSEGASVTVSSPAFSDNAGNTAAAGAASETFKVDLSDPTNVAFSGGPADGSSHYFGSVPAAPTCTASDAISGLVDCVVTGYGAGVGTHTLTATATDNAGRTATATRSYTVLAWTVKGFYQPVDMNGVINTVKAGSTVPLKFEIFAGNTELTDVASVKQPFVVKVMACDASATSDEIEVTTTGGTVLRYDPTAGQFVWNWQTPKTPGFCYRVTVTAQDATPISANFKLK
jgi:hypothetical protein